MCAGGSILELNLQDVYHPNLRKSIFNTGHGVLSYVEVKWEDSAGQSGWGAVSWIECWNDKSHSRTVQMFLDELEVQLRNVKNRVVDIITITIMTSSDLHSSQNFLMLVLKANRKPECATVQILRRRLTLRPLLILESNKFFWSTLQKHHKNSVH